MMEALRKAIEEQGVGLEKSIVKVDSFLNHRIDVALSTEMGRALAAAFAEDHVELVLTAEASGIAVALTTAQALGNVRLLCVLPRGRQVRRPACPAQLTLPLLSAKVKGGNFS